MPAATQSPETSNFQLVDESEGKMRQVVKGVETIEQKADSDSATKIEGYVATKGVDRAGDFFTEEALQEMAQQIQQEVETGGATLKAMFPNFNEEDLKQIKQSYTNNGNVDHYNNPGFDIADPRTVSAYKIVDAEYDGFGVKITAELNEDLPFGVPEAIKAALQEGYLDGFSVEFVAKRATNVVRDGRKVRKIMSSLYTGAALTGRPLQSSAAVTDAEFKSAVGEVVEEDSENKSFIKGLEELADEQMNKQEVKSYLDQKLDEKAQEIKNDITGESNMPEDEPNDPEQDSTPEDGEDQDNVDEQEGKSQAEELREELDDMRQEIKSVVEENKELRSEKEELEQKFDNLDEDIDGIQEVKSGIDELKQELKNVNPENTPQQDVDETRDDQVSEQEAKSALEKQLENYGNPTRVIEDQSMKSAIADRHDVTEDEVEKAANKVA